MKDFCEALFGTESRDEIIRSKTSGKQIRAIAGGKDNVEVNLTEDECKNLCKACNNFEYLSGYETRIRQYTVTDETVDRYGDIVRASGVSLENYVKNPVMQFAHDYAMPPIGISIKTWYDKQANALKSLALFLDDRVDTTGRADLIWRFVRSNGMRACSIGFDPIQWNNPQNDAERKRLGLGQYGVEYTASDMLEFSPVPLPANPNCLSNGYLKSFGETLEKTLRSGLFTAKDVGVLKAYPLFEDSVIDAFIKELGTKSVSVSVNVEVDDSEKEKEDEEKPMPENELPEVTDTLLQKVNEIEKQMTEMSNNISMLRTDLEKSFESFRAEAAELVATAQKTLTAAEISRRKSSLYDNENRIKEILKIH